MDKLMKSKKLMFVFSMLSLFGLMVGVYYGFYLGAYYGYGSDSTLYYWFFWSLPLIIQLIYIAIFRDSSKSD